MNNKSLLKNSILDGTKTAENLKSAFLREAQNYAKEGLFSKIADKDEDYSVYKTLFETLGQDKAHAELWLSYLEGLGDTFENLASLIDDKDDLGDDLYPYMAQIAKDEGFDEIAEKMLLAAKVKKSQSELLKEEAEKLTNPSSAYSENPETLWCCHICGYSTKGNLPPERCPLCSYPSSFCKAK